MWIFNFIVASALFASLSLGQNCRGQVASGAPPSGASKVALAATVGGVTSFSASGCTLQITRAGALPTGQCNAQINGVSTCNSTFTIFIGNGTFRSFAGGSDTRPACFTDIFDCNQGISVAQNSAGGGDNGGGVGGSGPPGGGGSGPPGGGGSGPPGGGGGNEGGDAPTNTPTNTPTSPPTTQPTTTQTITASTQSTETTTAPETTATCDADDDCCSNDDGCS